MTTPVTLDEDTYTEAISRIIERDFFPHLAQMKAESSYHEAQLNGDVDQLRQARQTLSQLTTNQDDQVPVNQLQNYYHPEESDLAKRINLQLSLDQFQTVYTSEDNASFTDLLEKANAKRKSHYRWFYDKQAQQLCIEDDKTRSDTSKGGNLLMYYPEGPSKSILADVQHRGAPKSITHANTMLTTLPTTTTTTTLLQRKEEEAPWAELCGDQSTSAFRGFDLVESTPTIHPSSMEVPLMTWGSIEGTPIRIAQPGTPAGPQFSLPKESQREKLGKALSEKASRAYRKRTNERNQHVKGTPRTGSGLMSPAAQHLLRRSNTPYTKGIDMDLRSSYGGSPRSTTPLFRAGGTSGRFKTPTTITPRP